MDDKIIEENNETIFEQEVKDNISDDEKEKFNKYISSLSNEEISDLLNKKPLEPSIKKEYSPPILESVEVDKNKIVNIFDKNETYYIIYSDTCMLCKILLKYIKLIKFKYKLVNIVSLMNLDSSLGNIGVPYIINSKKQKININSLIDILKEHDIKSYK